MTATAFTAAMEADAPAGLPRLLAGLRRDRPLTLSEHLAQLGEATVQRDFIELVHRAGLRGRGGAAFPTARKLRAVRMGGRRPILVVNAVESEPASAKDKLLVRIAPHLVLDGATAAAAAVGAREAVVAVAETAIAEARSLQGALHERRHDRLDVTLAYVPDAFVTGEETALLQALAGRSAKPTVKPPYPFERGLGGRPTLVQNAETLAHLALIARFGPSWFRSVGTDDAPGSALVTVTGAMERAGVREVALGSSLGEHMLRATQPTQELAAFLVGGYFGRWIAAADAAQLRLTPERLGAGAIVAFPQSVCALADIARVTRYLARQSAGQCGPCKFGLTAIADTVEELAHGASRTPGKDIARLRRWCKQVRGRGACRHPDGAAGFVESALAVFGSEVEHHARHGSCGRPVRSVLPLPAGGAW